MVHARPVVLKGVSGYFISDEDMKNLVEQMQWAEDVFAKAAGRVPRKMSAFLQPEGGTS